MDRSSGSDSAGQAPHAEHVSKADRKSAELDSTTDAGDDYHATGAEQAPEVEEDEFDSLSPNGDDPATIGLVDEDADFEAVDSVDPDVAAIDKALSASRRQRKADSNNNIRRMLEERSEARRLQQDLDYLDFDD